MDILGKLIPHTDENNTLHSGEAYILWTQLVARYDTLQLAEFIYSQAHDADFKVLVNYGIKNHIQPQIEKTEKIMRDKKIPLPERPPQNSSLPKDLEQFTDEWSYRIILAGAQSALSVHIKAINIAMNDEVRETFIDFLHNEIDLYNKLVKYGKGKGWVRNAPQYVVH